MVSLCRGGPGGAARREKIEAELGGGILFSADYADYADGREKGDDERGGPGGAARREKREDRRQKIEEEMGISFSAVSVGD